MNIDLLRSQAGEFGLICDDVLPAVPQAALFEFNKGTLSIEFDADHDAFMCNVPIVEEWRTALLLQDTIVLGCIVSGVVHTAELIPLRTF